MRKSVALIIAVTCALPAMRAAFGVEQATATETPAVQAKQVAQAKKAAKDEQASQAKQPKIKSSALFSFDQAGGITGGHRTFETTLKQLPKADADKLSDLIRQSGLLSIKDEKKTNPKAADVFIYQFKLTSGRTKHQAVYDDTTLPESFRPLRDFSKTKGSDAGRT